MTGVDRTMYKLLVVGLFMTTVALALSMMIQISAVTTASGQGYPSTLQVITVLAVSGRFLLVLGALYWVPRFIKKIFPEVA